MKKVTLAVCATSLGLALVAGKAVAGTTDFNVTSQIVQSIAVNVTDPLRFGETSRPTAATTKTVAPADAGAALLTATGAASKNVQGSFASATTTMNCDTGATPGCAGATISVNAYQCSINGGAAGTTCTGAFNGNGDISNIRAGATENIGANQLVGNYTGTQTFNLVYTT